MPRPYETYSLAQLGSTFLDAYDEHIRCGDDTEMLNAIVDAIVEEIKTRVPDPAKLRALMDYHYKAWADKLSGEDRSKCYYELRVLMLANGC